ncbi:aspartate kinase, partial [Dehalococcoidia bacterium]|nr:aspartate kinase [Dehalococcoidia bacterium]
MTLIVQKYGGSSLANAELIKNVARRVAASSDAGNSVVAVVSAMGNATDQLLDMASQMSSKPEPRELDVLLSTGELRSCALLAMALNSSGHSAISLSGGQAGIQTDTSHGMARIAGLEPDRITRELSAGNIVVVA